MSSVIKNMEEKKSRQKSQGKANNAKVPTASAFFENIKSEFKKITWTKRDELKTYTQIVIGATFIMGMAIYGVDVLVQAVLNGLNGILRFILG